MQNNHQALKHFFTDLINLSLEYSGTIIFNPEMRKHLDPWPLDASYLRYATGGCFDGCCLTGQELLTSEQREADNG